MSNSDCSICLESLTNGTALASLFCGHVFHHECILKCSEHQRSTCPLCQKDIYLYQHPVIRLYFDSDSTSNTQTPDDRYEKLKSAQYDLTNKLALLEQKYAQKKKRLQQSEQQRLACEKQKKTAIDTMNTYKRISGVLALEARLNTHDMQQHMQRWRQMDKEDLCLATANLAQRLNTLHKALDSKEKFLERINARMKTMKSRYRAMKLEDAEAKRLETSRLEREKRKRFFNPDELLSTRKRDKRPAIQVDSGEETDDPDDLFWVPPANTDIPTDGQPAQSNQTGESSSSSSRNSTTESRESGHRIPETPKRQLARKKRLQEMGLYGNGYLRSRTRSTSNDSNGNGNNQNNSNSTTHNIIEDDDVSLIDDDDVGYGSPTSPLPPLRIVSPVRHIALPRLARLSRVIELSSDEETETTHS